MPTPQKPLPMRQCRYCRAKFRPGRSTQRFCQENHRKAFFKYGGLPYDKLRDQMRRDIQAALAPMQAQLDALDGDTAALAARVAEWSEKLEKISAIAGV